MKPIRLILSALLACLLVYTPLADAAQISRLHADTISNGDIANASDLNDEYNNLYNESNSQDTRLTNIESGSTTFSGSKVFSGTTTFSGTSTFSSTANFTSHFNLGRPSDVSSPVEGDFWYNSTGHLAKFYDGTTTQTVATTNFIPLAARGHLAGLKLSNDGTNPNTDIDTASGVATDSTNVDSMVLGSSMVKRVSTAWAVGSGNGCLDTGTIPISGTVHIFLIKRTDTGVVDELCSVSASSPTMPSGYTEKRRIGSIETDSSTHIIAFKQYGDRFEYVTPILDVNDTTQSTTAITRTLSVPAGIQVEAIINASVSTGTGTVVVYFRNLDLADVAASTSSAPLGQVATANGASQNGSGAFRITTSTSAQISTRATAASTTVKIATLGWVDTRGRFD